MAVALKREDVGCDAVEEPAVMADDHGAAGVILQRFFERAQGFHVEIVVWLVEQQDIRALLQDLARCTRLRSPPESMPTFFCWSPPLKLKALQ